MQSERDAPRNDTGHRPGLLIEDFVPTAGAAEMVGRLTPWPAPISHDTPTPPLRQIGALCTVQGCTPTVSLWPSRQPASVRYHPTGLCVACHERHVADWKRQAQRKKAAHA
jgi:hypothetical protein